jgi:hypothetical protein
LALTVCLIEDELGDDELGNDDGFLIGVDVGRVIGLAVVERPRPEGHSFGWVHAWVQSLLPTELIIEPLVSFDPLSPQRAELPSEWGPYARVLTLFKEDEPIPDLDDLPPGLAEEFSAWKEERMRAARAAL